MATGRGLRGVVVAWAVVGGLLAGCAPRREAPRLQAGAEPYVIVRNLTGDPARVYLNGGSYGELLGVVPPMGMARFRVPTAIADAGRTFELAVARGREDAAVPVLEVGSLSLLKLVTREWTFGEAGLTGLPLRDAAAPTSGPEPTKPRVTDGAPLATAWRGR